ncbi:MAG: hypothetical protein QW037_03690 [Thermoplasmata archaeon]
MLNKYVNLELNGKKYIIYGTVRGLLDEENDMEKLYKEFAPDLILVGIPDSELNGLFEYLKEPFMVDLSEYEIIYGIKLQKYGKVKLHVPSYLKAAEISRRENIKIIPIDIPENDFSQLYTKKISTFMLIRHSLRKKRLYKKRFKASTPEEFSILWDKEITKISGFKELENEREKYMAKKIKENIIGKKILVVVDYERMEGIISYLI